MFGRVLEIESGVLDQGWEESSSFFWSLPLQWSKAEIHQAEFFSEMIIETSTSE
jgi:hypothetical protein